MPTPDQAHNRTEEALAGLEQRIARIYQQARDSLAEVVRAYFAAFQERDEQMKGRIGTVQNGSVWTEKDYLQWRLNQIGRGERFRALRDRIAARITNANEEVMACVNEARTGIYAMNRNYAAYTIELAAGNVGFTLWDEVTVKRLLREQPDLMPYYPKPRAVQRGIDLKWGKQQITKAVTQGILQGKSVWQIAADLQARVAEMNRTSAVRAARTAVTGAQNGGRMDAFLSARRRGIALQKEWVATLDSRTRHTHRRLDGEVVDYDRPFSNGCRYPGDPRGRPGEVYNCRCTMVAKVRGVDTGDGLRRDRYGLLPDMTYAQWERQKRGEGAT